VEIRDKVIAEHSAGVELEESAPQQDLGSALPPREQGRVPERSVADRMRERFEGAG
jgi:hypothetical protein